MWKLVLSIGLLVLAHHPAETQNSPQLCSESSSMAFNATQLSGVWWEVARSPALSSLACVKVNFTVNQPQNLLQIATTYSVSTSYLWVNQTMYANVSLDSANTANANGYNISYVDGITTTKYTVYKLLDTDYDNYALFCGYTNATNNATSFGIILTRNRYPNTTDLNNIENANDAQYDNFSPDTMSLVTQSPTCYAAGAVGQTFAVIYALSYAILNFLI